MTILAVIATIAMLGLMFWVGWTVRGWFEENPYDGPEIFDFDYTPQQERVYSAAYDPDLFKDPDSTLNEALRTTRLLIKALEKLKDENNHNEQL